MDYVSLNNPDREGRIIAPHTLVWTGLRWHVRGWCEKNRDFRDFVLSRFRGLPEILGPTDHSVEDDIDWNTTINLDIVPDPRLSPEQQAVIADDFGMCEGVLHITLRARLLNYLVQLLNINTGTPHDDPRAQQVIIANQEAVADWLI